MVTVVLMVLLVSGWMGWAWEWGRRDDAEHRAARAEERARRASALAESRRNPAGRKVQPWVPVRELVPAGHDGAALAPAGVRGQLGCAAGWPTPPAIEAAGRTVELPVLPATGEHPAATVPQIPAIDPSSVPADHRAFIEGYGVSA